MVREDRPLLSAPQQFLGVGSIQEKPPSGSVGSSADHADVHRRLAPTAPRAGHPVCGTVPAPLCQEITVRDVARRTPRVRVHPSVPLGEGPIGVLRRGVRPSRTRSRCLPIPLSPDHRLLTLRRPPRRVRGRRRYFGACAGHRARSHSRCNSAPTTRLSCHLLAAALGVGRVRTLPASPDALPGRGPLRRAAPRRSGRTWSCPMMDEHLPPSSQAAPVRSMAGRAPSLLGRGQSAGAAVRSGGV